jgi:LysM repeat protein
MTVKSAESFRGPNPFTTTAWCALSLMLAACGGAGGHIASVSDLVGHSSPSPEHSQKLVEEAVSLLGEGKTDAARKRLVGALKDTPNYPAATTLLQQIDKNPAQLLGKSWAPYTVKQGDTFASIAQKTIGDPMMFYALARYNGFAEPNALTPGQSILIPQKERPPVKKAVRKPVIAKDTVRAPDEPAPKPARVVERDQPAAPSANPGAAKALRASALTALNNGAVNKAVQLLRAALSQDPQNSVIKNDLGRALRIQKSLGGR